jgi:TetR/AcrR family transcriptional regulator, transcriptional repressor of bet genes
LLQATMRHLLSELNADTRQALGAARTPRERVSAVIAVSFSDKQFQPETIAAWLSFYVEAQKSMALRRLLRVYARRLHSNLMSGLRRLLPHSAADHAAEGIAALIDGLYIRRALKDGTPNAGSAIALVTDYLDMRLAAAASAAPGTASSGGPNE